MYLYRQFYFTITIIKRLTWITSLTDIFIKDITMFFTHCIATNWTENTNSCATQITLANRRLIITFWSNGRGFARWRFWFDNMVETRITKVTLAEMIGACWSITSLAHFGISDGFSAHMAMIHNWSFFRSSQLIFCLFDWCSHVSIKIAKPMVWFGPDC